MAVLTEYYPQFFTATVPEWKHLKEDSYKDNIISSLQFLIHNKRVAACGFVIMPNHIPVIWLIAQGHKKNGFFFLEVRHNGQPFIYFAFY